MSNSFSLWLHEDVTAPVCDSNLTDYKIMCFGGKARCEFTCTGRASGDLRVDFFDTEWNHLPFTRHYPSASVPPEAPAKLKDMIEMSEKLSEDIPFVRVDFYEVAGEFYFGELTFYPGNGLEEFDPESWDTELGSWLELPENVGGGWLLMSDDWMIFVRPDSSSCAPRGTIDYKFYCFDGEPRFLYVSQGLENHETASISFLTMDWEFEPFIREDYAPFETLPCKPCSFDEMIRLSKELSAGLPFVRADFYDFDGKALFSELTFHPCSGFMPFSPVEYDLRVGEMLKLPDCPS